MKLPPAVQWLLWPLSLVYDAGVRLRAWCYRRGIFKQRRLAGVVVSVGNLTVGGTGKTPMVMWIAQRWIDEGKAVGVLTRGYRGRKVGAERGRLRSDEAALLRERLGKKAHLGIGADRYEKGSMLERLGIEWLVLDDGFQHLALARDVDIVLIDATDPFGSGHMLPAGRLREPKSALSRADLIVITRSEQAPGLVAVLRHHTAARIYYAQTQLQGVFPYFASAPSEPLPDPSATPFFAFCGIGNPGAFFQDLYRWGFPLAGGISFRDHHHYSQANLDALEGLAKAAGAAALLCTEKDTYNFDRAEIGPLPLYYCQIALALSDPDGFWKAASGIIERKRAGAPR